jgi:hypothetical protein
MPLISLLSGLIVFIFADQITNLRYLQKSSVLSSINKQSKDLLDEQAAARTLITKLSNPGAQVDKEVVNKVDRLVDDYIRPIVEKQEKIMDEYRGLVRAIGLEEASTNEGKNTNRDPYAAFFARLGSLVILFLAVQVFNRLYRFNLVLAGDYDAVADALEIASQ